MGILDNLAANKSALLGLSGGLTGYGHPFTNFGYGTRSAIAGQQEDRLRRQQMIEEALMAEAAAKQRRTEEMYARIGEQLSQTEPFQPASGILKDVDTTQIAQVPGYDTSIEPTREAGPLSFMQDAIKEPEIAKSYLEGEFKLIPEGQGTPLGKSGQTEVQKSLLANREMLNSMKLIRKSFDPDFLTRTGRVRAAGLEEADRWGLLNDEQKAELTQRENMMVELEQLFNEYRREITGAAAAVRELELLKKAVLNRDMSPTQFQATFNQFIDKLEAAYQEKQAILAGGLPGSPPSVAPITGGSPFGASETFKRTFGGGNDPLGIR